MAKNYKKRGYRRNAKRVTKPKRKSTFAQRVKKVMSSVAETKQAFHSSGTSLVMFNSGIDATGDLQQIVPSIVNGTEQNQRIGQQIRAQKLNVKGYIKLNVNQLTDSTTLPSVIARMMVVSMKTAGNFNDAQTQAARIGTLLKKGGTTTAFTGLISDIHAPINTDVFTVHYDKRFYLNQSFINVTGPSPATTILSQDIKNTLKFFNINVKCKNRILKYDEDVSSDTLPTTFAPFLLLGYAYLDGSSPDTVSTNLGLQYQATLNYEDV